MQTMATAGRLMTRRRMPRLELVPLAALATLHPQVRDLAEQAPGGYMARDLGGIEQGNAELMCLLSPVVVVSSGRGRYQRIAGHRTYQVARTLLRPDVEVPVIVLQGRVTTEFARLLGAFSVSGWPLLASLDASGLHQIDAVLTWLSPGYRRATAGRPRRDADEPSRSPWALTSVPMSSVQLARICGVATSTIRRGRTGKERRV